MTHKWLRNRIVVAKMAYMYRCGLSIARVADAMGVDDMTVYNVFRQKRIPTRPRGYVFYRVKKVG